MLSQWLLEQGSRQAAFDLCVFIADDLILGIYVDDIIIAETESSIRAMVRAAGARFESRDMAVRDSSLASELTIMKVTCVCISVPISPLSIDDMDERLQRPINAIRS